MPLTVFRFELRFKSASATPSFTGISINYTISTFMVSGSDIIIS